MVMGDIEGKDLSIDLILALDSTEELDNGRHCNGHAVGVLSVCDVERRGAAFHVRNGKGM